MVAELLEKYIWLVDTFSRCGDRGLGLEEVQDKWEARFGEPYPRRSFNNHRIAVEEVFGINIVCNRSTNRYHIDSSDGAADEEGRASWLINSFTVNNMLSLSKEKLAGRISVEDIPSGQKHLTLLMDAMLDKQEISIVYQKYTSDEPQCYTLHPYAVKEDARRWYLVAWCMERGEVRVYALDRIREMQVRERTFRMPAGFDVDELFVTSYGTYISPLLAEKIIFRTTRKQAHYLRDLPIHHTQQEIGQKDGLVLFSVFVSPTDNLIMEFCRYGGELEVLSPASVRERVADSLRRSAELYDK